MSKKVWLLENNRQERKRRAKKNFIGSKENFEMGMELNKKPGKKI